VNPVRNDSETMSCQVCGTAFRRSGRRRHCSNACRQAAWRRRSRAPILPVVAKPDTVSQRPNCEARFLGKQRCQDCNTWARRLGPGGQCPCCDEPISVTELLQPDQFTARQGQKTTRGGDKEQRMKGAAAPDPQVLTISPTSAIQSGPNPPTGVDKFLRTERGVLSLRHRLHGYRVLPEQFPGAGHSG